MSQKAYYYVYGHTASGLQDFLPSNVTNIKHVFALNHPSLKVKTAVMKQFINRHENQANLEIIKSVHGEDYLDGVIVRDESVAVIAEPNPNIDNVAHVDLKKYYEVKNIDDRLLDKEKSAIEAAYKNFATGLKVHDNLEEIYINQMDFNRADQLALEFIDDLLKSQPKREKGGYIYRRLFGTNTSDGVVNVVPEIVETIANVYFIKGRAGTGKSIFMKKIAKACTDLGLDIELYHCSFDPNSIDMVLVRELDFCIFDSTDPHEFFPQRDGDQIIDLYEKLVAPGTDEKYAEEINKTNSTYKSYMKQGIENLKKAGSYRKQIESAYTQPDEKELHKIVESVVMGLY
ncbi:hypothetical protein [Lentibacillus sp. Marseille-P4043]|uniref:hypothetical protein n=1 Tax=Lentibacillus sp. Marseille-P4043 TaxID=2040293 RepID=UPI001F3746A6|nr:hypothetical protein [Lentibacillus sp. Marseille-P4043]